MSAFELASLVAEMRSAQKDYFRTRSASALDRSKKLERQVDDACKQLLSQPTLFEK